MPSVSISSSIVAFFIDDIVLNFLNSRALSIGPIPGIIDNWENFEEECFFFLCACIANRWASSLTCCSSIKPALSFGISKIPFLDNNLIELFISLNDEKKIYRGWTKYILRKTFEKLLPKEITWRKDKNGFSTDFEEKINNQYYYEYLNKYYFNDNAVIFNEKILIKKIF